MAMSKSSPPEPFLAPVPPSPRFCAQFRGVCVECPNKPHVIRGLREVTRLKRALPPFADRAIDALVRCRQLTDREREVLTRCCMGEKNAVIAAALGISASAVRRHLRKLHQKTNTCDKAELILNLWYSCQVPHQAEKPSPKGKAARPRRGRSRRAPVRNQVVHPQVETRA